MNPVNSQDRVRALLSAQQHSELDATDMKVIFNEIYNKGNFEEVIYFKDRNIFANSLAIQGAKFVLTANGLYDVETDQVRPYIKGERFIFVKAGRMF